MAACSYRHCQNEAVAEVSFKGGAFVPACEHHVKAYRAAAQSSGLSLREAALGESKFAQSPQDVNDLRSRVEALEVLTEDLDAKVTSLAQAFSDTAKKKQTEKPVEKS